MQLTSGHDHKSPSGDELPLPSQAPTPVNCRLITAAGEGMRLCGPVASPFWLWPLGVINSSMTVSGVFRLLLTAISMGCAPGDRTRLNVPGLLVEGAARGQVARWRDYRCDCSRALRAPAGRRYTRCQLGRWRFCRRAEHPGAGRYPA